MNRDKLVAHWKRGPDEGGAWAYVANELETVRECASVGETAEMYQRVSSDAALIKAAIYGDVPALLAIRDQIGTINMSFADFMTDQAAAVRKLPGGVEFDDTVFAALDLLDAIAFAFLEMGEQMTRPKQ